MNYDCSNEFDLDDIYAKLLGANAPKTIAMRDFFAPMIRLADFQRAMSSIVGAPLNR